MLLPKKRNYYIETVRSQYEHAHCKSDLDEAERVVKEMYPPYAESFSKVMNRKKLHILNMFVMKKNLFDTYCAWLFAILSELEKRIELIGRSVYEKRVFGFLAERLFNVWLEMRKEYEAKGLRWIVDYDCKRVRGILIERSSDITLKGFTLMRTGFW